MALYATRRMALRRKKQRILERRQKEREERMATDKIALDQGADAMVVKKGEICIQVSFRRSAHGVSMHVKTHERVEELLKGWGGGQTVDVKLLGRHWTVPDGVKLRAWDMAQNPGVIRGEVNYRLDAPGQPIVLTDEDRLFDGTGLEGGAECVNLSFLRLVDVSSGPGISFGIPGVYTTDAIRRMAEKIKLASRGFYLSYIRPINLSVMVSTQEIR